MEFEDISPEVQAIAAITLKEILANGNYDGYEQSATNAAAHVRTAFEVLFGKKLPDETIKMGITIDDHLGEYAGASGQQFNLDSVTVHRESRV